MIEQIQLSDRERDLLMARDEGHFLDFKSIRIRPASLTKTIAAFANTAGGELYIGIEDSPKHWAGFTTQEDANGHIQPFEELFPLGTYFSYTFLSHPGETGLVLQVQVQKTPDIKSATDGLPYVRRSAQNLKVDTEEKLARLRLDKGLESFEDHAVNAPIEFISNTETVIAFLLNVVPETEPIPWLTKQMLIAGGKPTVAGTMLFADEPQAAIPKRSSIKIFRYETTDDEGSRDNLSFDPLTIEGCAYDQIYAAVEKTKELIEEIRILTPDGLEAISYPDRALHEIITNAVLHRDYSIAVDIQIRIFDNRIEIDSPGRLPGHVTERNILREQFARNGRMVRLINKFPNPPNKDVGEGLNTAFDAMRDLRLKPPIISETESSVLVTIRHERLASPEEAVMQYLANHVEINNRTARELTAITSENAMKDVFYRLRDSGQIERVPDRLGSSAAWRKIT